MTCSRASASPFRLRDDVTASHVSVPAVGGRMPQSMRMVVVFPEPFGPRKPKISPCVTSNEIRSTATRDPKRFSRFLTRIALSLEKVIAELLIHILYPGDHGFFQAGKAGTQGFRGGNLQDRGPMHNGNPVALFPFIEIGR